MIEMLTYEQQEQARQARLNEVGDKPPCPMCGRNRVTRSDYIRCNPCGVNWLEGEDWDKDPKLTRYQEVIRKARTQATSSSTKGDSAGPASAK